MKMLHSAVNGQPLCNTYRYAFFTPGSNFDTSTAGGAGDKYEVGILCKCVCIMYMMYIMDLTYLYVYYVQCSYFCSARFSDAQRTWGLKTAIKAGNRCSNERGAKNDSLQ